MSRPSRFSNNLLMGNAARRPGGWGVFTVLPLRNEGSDPHTRVDLLLHFSLPCLVSRKILCVDDGSSCRGPGGTTLSSSTTVHITDIVTHLSENPFISSGVWSEVLGFCRGMLIDAAALNWCLIEVSVQNRSVWRCRYGVGIHSKSRWPTLRPCSRHAQLADSPASPSGMVAKNTGFTVLGPAA